MNVLKRHRSRHILDCWEFENAVGNGPRSRCRALAYLGVLGNLFFEPFAFGVKQIMQLLEFLNHAL